MIKNNMTRWEEKEHFSPIVAEIHLTNKCNLNCKTCWRHDQKVDYSNELSSQKWFDLIEQIISLDVKECYLGGGGEPMIRNEVTSKIMHLIKESGIKGVTTTNCTLFSKEEIKKLISIGWDHLQVSIDGPDEKTQDFLRGKGVYKKNVQILKMFDKLKKKLNKEEPHISFHTVVSNTNYDKLQKIVRFAISLNIREINLQPLVIQSKYCEKFVLNQEQKKELQTELEKAAQLARNEGVITNFEKFLKKEENTQNSNNRVKCFEPWNRITIQSDGLVKTCCNPYPANESIYKNTLKDIWRNKSFEKTRENFYKGQLMKECCTHPNKRV